MIENKLPIDVFKNVEILNKAETGRIVQKGKLFDETVDFPLKDLIPFFERDLFLASKENNLFKVRSSFNAIENETDSHVEVTIEDTVENIFSSEFLHGPNMKNYPRKFVRNYEGMFNSNGVHILAKIAQIFWSYNYNSYHGEIDGYERRFTYEILPSDRLLLKWTNQLFGISSACNSKLASA